MVTGSFPIPGALPSATHPATGGGGGFRLSSLLGRRLSRGALGLEGVGKLAIGQSAASTSHEQRKDLDADTDNEPHTEQKTLARAEDSEPSTECISGVSSQESTHLQGHHKTLDADTDTEPSTDCLSGTSSQECDDLLDESFEEQDLSLENQEAELTREVPTLLEKLNEAMAAVNDIEARVSEARTRHEQLLQGWQALYGDARLRCGALLDKTRQFFEVEQSLLGKEKSAQRATRRFSLATSLHEEQREELVVSASEDPASPASPSFGRAQARFERELVAALGEHREAQLEVQRLRERVGNENILKARPVYRILNDHKAAIAAEHAQVGALEEELQRQKDVYSASMRALERISTSVHSARQEICFQTKAVEIVFR